MFRALEKCHVPWAAMPPCHTQPRAGLGPDPVQVPVAAQGPVANTPPSHTFTLLFGLCWVCTAAAVPRTCRLHRGSASGAVQAAGWNCRNHWNSCFPKSWQILLLSYVKVK